MLSCQRLWWQWERKIGHGRVQGLCPLSRLPPLFSQFCVFCPFLTPLFSSKRTFPKDLFVHFTRHLNSQQLNWSPNILLPAFHFQCSFFSRWHLLHTSPRPSAESSRYINKLAKNVSRLILFHLCKPYMWSPATRTSSRSVAFECGAFPWDWEFSSILRLSSTSGCGKITASYFSCFNRMLFLFLTSSR